MTPETTTVDAPVTNVDADEGIAIYSDEQLNDLRSRWNQIQAGFVDEPRRALEQANALVDEAITQLADGFARTRENLDQQWKRDGAVSTEEMRQALRRYRSFFTRVLNT
jgi:hypothetical protein